MVYAEFTWVFVCSIFLALFVAYGIGANDVANAFGSSVGAKALTMKQAIVVAAICEFGGAVLLGAGVTSTIRSNIANLNDYKNKPDLYMYGMLCALLATGIWLIVATYFELPVSTTHSIVGSVIGMSMVAAGASSGALLSRWLVPPSGARGASALTVWIRIRSSPIHPSRLPTSPYPPSPPASPSRSGLVQEQGQLSLLGGVLCCAVQCCGSSCAALPPLQQLRCASMISPLQAQWRALLAASVRLLC
jgi:hypothetical protein